MKNRVVISGLAVVLSAALASTASAGVVGWTLQHVDNSDAAGEDFDPSEWVTQDLLINFEHELRAQQVFIELTQGEIFSAPGGGQTPPDDTFIGAFPELAYDTFLSLGGRTQSAQTLFGAISMSGGAVDIMSQTERDAHGESGIWESQMISRNWFPESGVVIEDPTDEADFFIGRFTLSHDAEGTFRLFSSASEAGAEPSPDDELVLHDDETFRIENGQIIPEPGTLALIGAGGALTLLRRRERQSA